MLTEYRARSTLEEDGSGRSVSRGEVSVDLDDNLILLACCVLAKNHVHYRAAQLFSLHAYALALPHCHRVQREWMIPPPVLQS